MELNYQKYLIKKIDDIYKQIKMSIGLPFISTANDFMENTLKLSNFSNIIRFKKIILDPLKHELENNKLVFSPEVHLCLKKWNDTYISCVTLIQVFDDIFKNPIVTKDSKTISNIREINYSIFSNIIVELYGKYRLNFLNFEMDDLTKRIINLFDLDLNSLTFIQLLEEETSLFLKILEELNISKKQTIINDLGKMDFLNKLESFNNLLNLLLAITYKIIIEFELLEIDLNKAYIFIKDFK